MVHLYYIAAMMQDSAHPVQHMLWAFIGLEAQFPCISSGQTPERPYIAGICGMLYMISYNVAVFVQ